VSSHKQLLFQLLHVAETSMLFRVPEVNCKWISALFACSSAAPPGTHARLPCVLPVLCLAAVSTAVSSLRRCAVLFYQCIACRRVMRDAGPHTDTQHQQLLPLPWLSMCSDCRFRHNTQPQAHTALLGKFVCAVITSSTESTTVPCLLPTSAVLRSLLC
jgi:hypothetical protein